jgi:hypothetical protein
MGEGRGAVLEVDREVKEVVLRLDAFAVAGELGVFLGAVLVEDSHESPLPAISKINSNLYATQDKSKDQ